MRGNEGLIVRLEVESSVPHHIGLGVAVEQEERRPMTALADAQRNRADVDHRRGRVQGGCGLRDLHS
jgi:hypothetical protein